MVSHPAFLGAVPMRGYQPAYARHLAQGPYVEIKPNVNVNPNVAVSAPINVELGGLPLSLGLFAGSALSFYLKSQVPDGWPKTIALIGGAGLAAAGVINLLMPKAHASEAKSAPAGAPAAPAGGAPSEAPVSPGGTMAPKPYSASDAMAFENVVGRIAAPTDFSTINISPWANTYPVRVQLQNVTSVPVTFEMELKAEEDPQPVGASQLSSLTVQVSLAPKEIRDIDVNMPISAWGIFSVYVDVMLTARKRRAPGENAQLIDTKSFVVK